MYMGTHRSFILVDDRAECHIFITFQLTVIFMSVISADCHYSGGHSAEYLSASSQFTEYHSV
jgi:hypothetical protein